jgi:phospholipid/cholesterol/gamma-HCH transport system substrate-binding protein
LTAVNRNVVTTTAAIKLGIFSLASVIVTSLLVVIMGHVGLGDQTTYQAVFSNASQLLKGDDVRVAGVSVGEVKKVEVLHRTEALVTFKVKSDLPLTTRSRAEIRFLNLVGDRYLGLEEGRPGAPRLRPDGTLPVTQTSPALDLTVLFNGFKPLFSALDPKTVNELSMNIVRTLQGEGGTIQSLLASTASLTNTLANRDQLIGEVIDNLSTLLGTVNDRHQQLNHLVTALKGWTGQLARDRKVIGASISNMSQLTRVVAEFLTQGRPLLKSDIAELGELTKRLSKPQNTAIIKTLLDQLPEALTDQTRTGTYGSWYNYYLCGFRGDITLPKFANVTPAVTALLDQLQKKLSSIAFHSDAQRCSM